MPRTSRTMCKAEGQSDDVAGSSRRTVLGAGVALTAGSALQGVFTPQAGATVVSPEWEQVQLPVDPGVVLLDIGFTGDDPNHGMYALSPSMLTDDAPEQWGKHGKCVSVGRALHTPVPQTLLTIDLHLLTLADLTEYCSSYGRYFLESHPLLYSIYIPCNLHFHR